MSVTTVDQDFIRRAQELADLFEKDAIERDQLGGTPKAQRDALRDSGLLNLLIPKEWGGHGQTWSAVMQVTRVLSTADSSLGHLFAYHNFAIFYTLSNHDRDFAKRHLTASASNNWFWGNSANPLDKNLEIRKSSVQGASFVANGHKSFSSGSPDSDILTLMWIDPDDNESFFVANIPSSRKGVTIHDDWDHIGQRQTGSGTVSFENVEIYPDEAASRIVSPLIPFSTIGSILSQSVLTQVFIGCAIGALKEAKNYTRSKARAWNASGVEAASEDPYILRNYGEYWVQTEAAISLADRSLESIDAIWEKGNELTSDERSEAAVLAAAANVFAGQVGLEVSSRVFEVMGARSAARGFGYDRFWRNVRTHTLHNPADYKLRTVGNWHLNDQGPTPSSYS
ncbi:acyl-CoA dehydrogenase family protein [Paenibacillus sp. GCM10012307]|uniref:Dibenzothiophene monooxygenase n=1 Tax=Paenibacillus roseus TaxID=2798579 RepID=A0A934MR13_9BACL|nr:acyl-CoA dehydrogenase family protein [Paenibacillus roseus]MBJ6362438.1 acyl-CoA dehydrogenase family protein [Paenibacillus roseus]